MKWTLLMMGLKWGWSSPKPDSSGKRQAGKPSVFSISVTRFFAVEEIGLRMGPIEERRFIQSFFLFFSEPDPEEGGRIFRPSPSGRLLTFTLI